MSRKILNVPYEVELEVRRQAPMLVERMRFPHATSTEREDMAALHLSHWWKLGYAAKESFGFRWGLVIGAATGGLIVCIANALGGAL